MTTRSQAAAWASALGRSSVTTTPLPAASPSSLTTYGGPNSSSAAADLVRGRADAGARGRHPGGGHHLLGEGLGALERRGRRGRPEAGDARRAHGVGDPGDQRRLGADHDQVGAELAGQGGDRRAVGTSTACSVATSARCPGCPGRACTSVTAGSRASARHQRVLPAAARR